MSAAGGGQREERGIGLPDGQLAILSEEIVGRLVDAAADLTYLDRSEDPDGEVREVAAYGRLAQALHHRRIFLPDPEAASLLRDFARAVAESEEHRRVLALHAALDALGEVLG